MMMLVIKGLVWSFFFLLLNCLFVATPDPVCEGWWLPAQMEKRIADG